MSVLLIAIKDFYKNKTHALWGAVGRLKLETLMVCYADSKPRASRPRMHIGIRIDMYMDWIVRFINLELRYNGPERHVKKNAEETVDTPCLAFEAGG